MKSVLVAETAETAARHGAVVAVDLPEGQVPALTAAERRDLADNAARLVIVLLFSVMVYRIGMNYLETGRLTGLLLLASEALVVVLTVIRRSPVIVDRSVRARVLTTIAMMGPPLVAPAQSAGIVPDTVTLSICAVGLLVVIAGKLSLGRSFGLIPANRGIVSSGLYRVVRHPIYLGYLITHIAFVAAHPTWWNLMLLGIADLAQMARAVCEEQTLAQDEQYRAYQATVRWRVVPGVF